MRKTDPLPPVANRLEWLCAVFGSDLEFQESFNAAYNLQLCLISAHSNRSSLSLCSSLRASARVATPGS